MSENLNAHVTNEVLNEFLDQTLERSAKAAAEAHLAACQQCSARLAELSAVFVRLAALPDRPPENDLAPGVMAMIRRHPRAAIGQAESARSKAGSRQRPGIVVIVGALQALGAPLLLAFAWPIVASFWATLPAPAFIPAATDLASTAQRITALLSDSHTLGSNAQAWLQAAAGQLVSPRMPMLEPSVVRLGLAAAGVVWLLGNALLLSGRRRANTRRHS